MISFEYLIPNTELDLSTQLEGILCERMGLIRVQKLKEEMNKNDLLPILLAPDDLS